MPSWTHQPINKPSWQPGKEKDALVGEEKKRREEDEGEKGGERKKKEREEQEGERGFGGDRGKRRGMVLVAMGGGSV